MTDDKKKTSVTHKLQALALKEGVSTQELRTELLLERLTARLISDSTLKDIFIFKGGFVSQRVYRTGRFTQDIDISSKILPPKDLTTICSKAASHNLNDACWFELRSVEPLKLQVKGGGNRLTFFADIGAKPATIPPRSTVISMDVSYTEVSVQKSVETPSILKLTPLDWKVCGPEVTVAEKIHALLWRGEGNTRARDIYDIYKLVPSCDEETLAQCLKNTFKMTNLPLPKNLIESLRQLNVETLREAWNTGLSYIGPKTGFSYAWEYSLRALTTKLNYDRTKSLSRKL